MEETKVPRDIIEELRLKIPLAQISEDGKIIVEPHQMSVRIPPAIRKEIDLPEGSNECEVTFKVKKKELIVRF